MALNKLPDLREMELDEILSWFYNQDVDECIEDYLAEFISSLGEFNMFELFELYGISEISLEAIRTLPQKLEKSFLSGFLGGNLLRDIPIKGHYEVDGVHLFPVTLDTVIYCEECKKFHCTVVCVYVTEDEYGISAFTLDNQYTFINDNIRTLSDVWEFINEQSDISSYPLLV